MAISLTTTRFVARPQRSGFSFSQTYFICLLLNHLPFVLSLFFKVAISCRSSRPTFQDLKKSDIAARLMAAAEAAKKMDNDQLLMMIENSLLREVEISTI